MSNKAFLKEFQYYKKNPEEYKHKGRGLALAISIIVALIWFVLLFTAMSIEKEETARFVLNIAAFYMFVGFFIIAGMFIRLSYVNERVIDFEDMIYKGSISGLFKDINHPAIKNARDIIKHDLEYCGGISGSTVYEIYSNMKNKSVMAELSDKEKAKKALAEINALS